MKNSKTVLPVLAILLCVSLSCTFLKDKFVKDPNAISTKVIRTEIQPFDRNAPLASPGAEVVRRLAELDPSLAKFGADVEAVERAAMQRSIDELPGEPETPQKSVAASSWKSATDHSQSAVPAAMMMFQGDAISSPADRARAASVVGAVVAGLKQIFSQSQSKGASGGVKDRKTETKNGTTTTFGAELSFRDDGSSTFELELKTEAVKDGSKLVAELKGRVEGLDCPNAEGQVPITAKLRLGGESGGVGYTQEIEAFIRTTVDDDANITLTTIDIVQGTREIVKGNDIYIETGFTVRDTAGTSSSEYDNWRIIRNSQSATEDIAKTKSVAESGQASALAMAMTVLAMAEQKWQNGGCVKIDAPSPGSVAVNSTTQIPVKVVHKFDGAEVPSKLKAALSGGASVDPTLIPKTAGTLSYVAPGETGKTATISLSSSSRRGRATLDLTASTGGNSYQIVGGLDDWKTDSKVCDIMKPFQLKGSYGIVMDLTGGLSGTYSYKGQF
ncbi:MAG TPA: hypothetical protein VJ781_11840, partial [Pyrinomonadaceae bacterium]|nr:hypothetical protein [Pyrinomonadaceae bacterium]